MITVSTALVINDKVYGVVGADVTLEFLTSKMNDVTILDSGFLLLVTSEGLIISKPESWDYLPNPIRIYDNEMTGITEDQ